MTQKVDQEVASAMADVMMSQMTGKKFYLSKVLWVNVLAVVAILIQNKYGFVVGAELQAVLLSLVNVGLRKVTKDPIVW